MPIVERNIGEKNGSMVSLASPDSQGEIRVTDWSVEADQFGEFICQIFDEWVRHDVGKYFVQLFDVALGAWLKLESSICIFRKTCGQAMAIEHNGDLYSCDHYVYPQYKLGNIMDDQMRSLIGSEFQQKFGEDKWDKLPKYCLECDVRFACNGECPKHRFTNTPDEEGGLNYLCAGYKRFFTHIDPYMRYMANELKHNRPANNILTWVKEKDQGFASYKLGPNEPCPCGSGKKIKKCCSKIR
jgi:uncharacterized protein